jgi:hypothetical protein
MGEEICYHGRLILRYDTNRAYLSTAVSLGAYQRWLLVLDPVGNRDLQGADDAWIYYSQHHADGDPMCATGVVINMVFYVASTDDC